MCTILITVNGGFIRGAVEGRLSIQNECFSTHTTIVI